MRSQAVAVALSCIALALFASQTFHSPIARANHDDGHLHDWSLAPGAQTALLQKLVSGPTPTLCSDEFPSSTQTAATRWRTTAGTVGLEVSLFTDCPADFFFVFRPETGEIFLAME